jgi:hypothetical protein
VFENNHLINPLEEQYSSGNSNVSIADYEEVKSNLLDRIKRRLP